MKTSISNCKLLILLKLVLVIGVSFAQKDSSLMIRTAIDTSKIKMNSDAIYNRPFLQYGKIPVALGGYVEANSNYSSTDGVSEGLSFQFKRLTLFTSSTITKKIKFLSEIEFEDGTKEINIEFAALDIEFHPLLNLRSGIVMNPIGAFNQNHDGPRWEFIDRPISATQMLPATWSNVGFGLHGKLYQNNLVFAYEAYLTNGFDESIVDNAEGKTFLPASKKNIDRFEESSNGQPLFTAKIAVKKRRVGELGVSYMGGIYNQFIMDGVIVSDKKRLDVFAIDLSSSIPVSNTSIIGEFAIIKIDIAADNVRNFGNMQYGGFIDIVQPIFKRKIFSWENTVLNFAIRAEFVDWNVGKFEGSDLNKFEHVYGIVPGISFRPSPQTVLRFNYRYQWQTDLLGNPAAKTASVQFGLSSYF